MTDVCFSSTSNYIAFGCDDSSVGIVNVRSKKLELILRDHDQAYSIRAVAFNCYDTLIASASSNGELVVNARRRHTSDAAALAHDENKCSPE